MVKVKEEYFKTKFRPAGMLLNCNAMICFEVRLQSKFRIKNYSSTVVNFHAVLRQKKNCINLILKSRADNNKSYHKKRVARRFIASSVLLKPFQQRLVDVTSFRLSKSLYSRSVPFKRRRRGNTQKNTDKIQNTAKV